LGIVVHFDYDLECGHKAIANVIDTDVPEAYRVGRSILCPDCRFQNRKIVGERLTKDGNLISEVKAPPKPGENPTPVE
jgi:hypothetical protein